MKNKQIFFVLFSVILFEVGLLSSNLFAQSPPPIHFTHYTTDDGLPHDVGYQMLQDNQGYLWIGTDNGLARFDGNKFKVYADEEGLNNPYVIDFARTDGEDFFIGTWGNGIFKKGNDTIFHLPVELIPQKIARLNAFDENYLEIWTKTGFTEEGYHTYAQHKLDVINKQIERVFFYKYDGNYYKSLEEQVEIPDSVKSSPELVKNIESDQFITNLNPSLKIWDQKKIYLTSEGVFKSTSLPSSPNSIKPYTYHPIVPDKIWRSKKISLLEPLDERLKGIQIVSVVEDQNGGIWLSSKGKINYLTPKGELSSYDIPINPITPVDLGIWQDKYLTFFAYQDPSKLFFLDIETGLIHEIGHRLDLSATISDIFIDKDDNLWLTTDGSGLYCLKPFSARNYAKEQGLENCFIYDLIEAKDGTIYGATKKGLYYYSEENWVLIDHEIINLDLHGGVEIQKNGNLLLGSDTKLNKIVELDVSSQKVKDIESGYLGRNFYLDNKDRIWSIKTFDLFHRLYKSGRIESLKSIFKERNWGEGLSENFLKKFFDIQKTRNDHFTALEVDNSTMLLGTSRGLFEVIGDSIKHFSKENGLPSTVINDITKSADGSIWIATEKGVCIKEGDQFLIVSAEGLLSTQARKLLFDHKGNLWLGTPGGLHYFIFSEATWIPITKNMGLIANDITCLLEDTKKRLWIGTSKGITMLPNEISQKRLLPPQVSLEKIIINNQIYLDKKKIKRIPFKSTFQLEFTALSFQSPKEIEFRYRLNLNEAWQTTRGRSIALFDLADGKYKFQIQAKKPRSKWSKIETFSFIVKPPWYRSLWFIGLVGLGILGMAQFLFLYRIRTERKKIEAEVQLKEQFAQLEMKALQAQMNPHFIFNAMNSIMDFVMNEDKYSANQYLAKFSKLMRLFLDASKSDYNSLGDELELISLYVELEKLRFKDKFDFKIVFDENLPVDLIDIPSILIQPFIENAIHHGLHLKKGKGKLEMRIAFNSSHLKIEIEDNGVGRTAAIKAKQQSLKTYKSRGTQIVEEKIALLNTRQDDHYSVKTIDLMDHAGRPAGTKVIIKISIQD